jgi:hypothetical protein
MVYFWLGPRIFFLPALILAGFLFFDHFAGQILPFWVQGLQLVCH